jgi:O-antigen ligase
MAMVFVNGVTFDKGLGPADEMEPKFSYNWGQPIRLAVCAACGLYGLALLRKSARTLLKGAGVLAVAFLAWAAVTVSSAIELIPSVGAVFCLGSVVLFAAAITTVLDQRQIVISVLKALLAFLIGSWIAYVFFPSFGREELSFAGGTTAERFGGLTSSQILGMHAALTVALLLVAGIQQIARWKTLALPLAFTAITLILTNSRTSMIAATGAVLIATVQMVGFARWLGAMCVLLPLAAAFGIFLVSSGLIGVNSDEALAKITRSGDIDEIYRMSGRTDQIWSLVLDKIEDSPVVGYGYGCSRFAIGFLHAHNVLLNVVLETGLIGGACLLLQAGVFVRRLFFSHDSFSSLVFIVLLVCSLTERDLFGPIPDSLTLLWFVALFSPPGRSVLSAPESTI